MRSVSNVPRRYIYVRMNARTEAGRATDRLASDAGPIVLHTSDAGESFSSQVLPAGVTGVGSIAFLDERVGLASASGIDGTTSAATPLVIVTSDGGASWSARNRVSAPRVTTTRSASS